MARKRRRRRREGFVSCEDYVMFVMMITKTRSSSEEGRHKGSFETRISSVVVCVTTTKRCATRECHLGLLPKGKKGERGERGREGGREEEPGKPSY